MSEALFSILVGTGALSVALVLALVLALRRPLPVDGSPALDHMLRLYLSGVAVQCLHFLEELLTGFQLRFPGLLDLAPWSAEFFVTFNVVWIAVWIAAAVALREGVRLASWPIWFFAIGMTLNAIAHPLLALATGGYFPGLLTWPFVGFVGVRLIARLVALTRR